MGSMQQTQLCGLRRARESDSGRLVWLGAAVFLVGCAAGPNFSPPSAPSARTYNEGGFPAPTVATPGAAGGAQIFVADQDVPAHWWRVFRSEALNELVAKALRSSPDLQAAEAALRQSQETLLAAKGAYAPAVDLNVGASRQRVGIATAPGTTGSSLYTLYNTSVGVSYALDGFGKLRRQVESVAAQTQAQRYRYEAAYLSLTSNVVTAAVREASLRAQIAETQRIIALEREQLAIVKRQFDLGGVTQVALLALQSQVAQVEATLPPLQNALSQVRNQLAVLAGQAPSEPLPEEFDLSALHLPEELPLSLPSKLVAQRPDIKASEALLHAASAEVGVATANTLPQLTISGSYGTQATRPGDSFSAGSVVWNLAAGLTQPLFHGGQLRHEKRAAAAAYDQAVAQYKSSVLLAFQDVADTLRALHYDAATLQAQASAESAAAQSMNIASAQFSLGAIGYLSLLDAQRSYHQARIALVQTRAARIADSAALFQALGGGWWNRNDESAATPDANAQQTDGETQR